MTVHTLTPENFRDTIQDNAMVLIDFWAPWCAPCRSFAPTFDAASEKHQDIIFAKVNTEQQQELASVFNIRSIPTLMFFRDQIIVFSQPGALPANALEQLIGQVRALDMDVVRTELATQQADGAG